MVSVSCPRCAKTYALPPTDAPACPDCGGPVEQGPAAPPPGPATDAALTAIAGRPRGCDATLPATPAAVREDGSARRPTSAGNDATLVVGPGSRGPAAGPLPSRPSGTEATMVVSPGSRADAAPVDAAPGGDSGATVRIAPSEGRTGGGRRPTSQDQTVHAGQPSRAPMIDSLPRKSAIGMPSSITGLPPGSAEGTPFGRYRLLSQLGSGGMGVVWKAWDTELRRMVALKQIKHQDGADADTVKRFLREARLAAKLRHQHIIGIHDVGEIDGRHYITMDYVDGRTLSGFLDDTVELKRSGSRKGMDRLRHEIRLLSDVGAAVGYAHKEGIVHRDLKPSNVLVDKEDRPYVMDFGLAKEIGTDKEARVAATQMTLGGQLLGTPAYMSPEQAAGDHSKVGARTDVWALGVMLYELLTGKLPFEGKNTWEILSQASSGDVPPPKRKYRHAPEELEAICLRALEKNPERRYETAEEFTEELMRWLRGDPVLAKKPTLAYYAWRWLSRRKARVASGIAAAALLSVALGWAWQERMRGHERARGMLEEIVVAVNKFEDQIHRTPLKPEAKELLARQPRNLLDRMILDDEDFGPAYSWRGKVRGLLGLAAEADDDLAQGCQRSPDDAETWFVRGMNRMERYTAARGIPDFARTEKGAQTQPLRAETAEEAALRVAGLADLAAMAAADVQRPAFSARERKLGDAMAALWSDAPDGLERAVSLTAGMVNPRAAKIRALALYRLGRYEEADVAFWETLGNWPQDRDAWRGSFLAREAARCGIRLDPKAALERARAARTAEEAAVTAVRAVHEAEARNGSATGSERLLRDQSDLVLALTRRGYASLRVAELEAEAGGGEEARRAYGDAVADLSEAMTIFDQDKRKAEMIVPFLHRGRAQLGLGRLDLAEGREGLKLIERAALDAGQVLVADRNPEVAEAFELRGRARGILGELYERSGQDPREHYVQADANFKAAIEKGDARARVSRAEFLHARGKLDDAIGELEAARAELPSRDAELAAVLERWRAEKK